MGRRTRKSKPAGMSGGELLIGGIVAVMVIAQEIRSAPPIAKIILVLLLIAAGAVVYRLKSPPVPLDLERVDSMKGTEFEKYLASLFSRLGYHAENNGKPGDLGGDLVVTRDGQRLLVQAKRYGRPVGPSAVQEAVAAIKVYRCNGAMVVTNNTFTSGAKKLAMYNNVILWDRDRLAAAISQVKKAEREPQPWYKRLFAH